MRLRLYSYMIIAPSGISNQRGAAQTFENWAIAITHISTNRSRIILNADLLITAIQEAPNRILRQRRLREIFEAEDPQALLKFYTS